MAELCAIEGCGRGAYRRGYCNPHYRQALATQRGTPHGTIGGYSNFGCRCDACSLAQRAYAREWRNANPDKVKVQRDNWRANNAARHRAARAAWRTANTTRVREQETAWRQANPERSKAILAKYAAANPTRLRQASLKWRTANPVAVAKTKADFAAANPDYFRRAAMIRRVRRAGADVRVVSAKDWRRLCERFGNRCAYCAGPGPLAQDHIIPLVRGGRHSIGNLLPACKPCNSRKGSKLLVEWQRFTRLVAELEP